jgi:hypothetical protein
MNQPNSEPSEQARKLLNALIESGFDQPIDDSIELDIIQRHMDLYHAEQSKKLVNSRQELERTLKAWREVEREAEHGRQKYGSGPSDFAHDDCHDEKDWIEFIEAKTCIAKQSTPREWRHKMVQICGLAMSAIRAFDRIQARAESEPLLKGPNE